MRLGTAYVVIKATQKGLKASLTKARMSVNNATKAMMRSIARVSFRALQVGALGAAVAIGKAIKDSIQLGREFGSTMKTVQAWSGASGKELEALKNIAREMGATTEWTATQAAEALKFLAAAGFTAKQSIAALPGTLDLATAGQVDLAAATDITTDVLTAFGMDVKELGRVNDAFITTASNSNTNVMMLGESFKMAAPTAKLFGFNVEQTAAMLGTLANSGVKATMAGSGLNMIMLRAAKAAKGMGMEGANLIEILTKLKEEEAGATRLGELFGARQVKTAAILMNNIGVYEKLLQKINENTGATSKLAKIMRDSLDVDIKTLSSTIEDVLLAAFDLYEKDLRGIIQGTTDWIRENKILISQGLAQIVLGIGDALKKGATWLKEGGWKEIVATFKTLAGWVKAIADGFVAIGRGAGIAAAKVAEAFGPKNLGPITEEDMKKAAPGLYPGFKPTPQTQTGIEPEFRGVIGGIGGPNLVVNEINAIKNTAKVAAENIKEASKEAVGFLGYMEDVGDSFVVEPKIKMSPAVPWSQGIANMQSDLMGVGDSISGTAFDMGAVSSLIDSMSRMSTKMEYNAWVMRQPGGLLATNLGQETQRIDEMYDLQMQLLKNQVRQSNIETGMKGREASKGRNIQIVVNAEGGQGAKDLAQSIRSELTILEQRGA